MFWGDQDDDEGETGFGASIGAACVAIFLGLLALVLALAVLGALAPVG